MKKIQTLKNKVLLLLLLTVAVLAKAQDKQASELKWPQDDAKWSYCIIGHGGEPFAKETWGVKGDSLIHGVRYNIIGLLDDNKATTKPNLLTRCQNDTVFRFVNGREYPYFKFDLEIGDVFTTFRSAGWMYSWNDSTCSSVLPLRVFAKETLDINGVELNRYLLADTLFSYLYGIDDTPVYELVDRIGVINAYPFINNAEGAADCSVYTDFSIVELFKYEDNSHTFLLSECVITSVPEYPLEEKIEVFPNPVSKSFSLNIENLDCGHYHLEIVSFCGHRMLEKEIFGRSATINVEYLPSGIYMIVLTPTDCLNKCVITKKIIINKSAL